MKLTTNMDYDFKLIDEGIKEEYENDGVSEEKVMTGEFFILDSGSVIGGVSVSSFNGVTYVSAETPEVNFSIDEWVRFITTIKERFRLDNSQSIMINKHPHSFSF